MTTLFRRIVESLSFQKLIIALIIINAITLGLETYPSLMDRHGALLRIVDKAILAVFVVELALRLMVYRLAFFKDAWNVFDFLIVGIALVPAQESFSVLRALRVLRVLRLISAMPRLKRVVQGLITAIPGIGSIACIMLLIFYVFAVMAAKLYGSEYPHWFGDLGISLFTLFQIMTLEGWAEIVREIMQTKPHAWVFFVIYILAATFTVLNLFIAVIVEAMQNEHKAEDAKMLSLEEQILSEIKALREEIRNK